MKQSKTLYSLIPLEEFKALLGIDDREDALARYCLTIATHTIEQHCMRRLLRKRHFEQIELTADLVVPLKEYPVTEVLAVYAMGNGELIEPESYRVVPDCGSNEDWPYSLYLSPAIKRCYPGMTAVKVIYWAGYGNGKVPPDLGAACLELAAWNMARYRGRKIGLVGKVKSNSGMIQSLNDIVELHTNSLTSLKRAVKQLSEKVTLLNQANDDLTDKLKKAFLVIGILLCGTIALSIFLLVIFLRM